MRVRSDVFVMCEMVKEEERVEVSWSELSDEWGGVNYVWWWGEQIGV